MRKKIVIVLMICLFASNVVAKEFAGERKEKMDQRENQTERMKIASSSDRRPTSSQNRIGIASSTENKKESRTAQATKNILEELEKQIARVENIISRLTNSNSIIAKLDNQGINTKTIKAKLNDSQTLINNAKKELEVIKTQIVSLVASSTPLSQTKVSGIKTSLKKVQTDIKSAISKVKEAYKLIKEIPGIQKIDLGNNRATSTSASSSTSR